MTKMGALAIGDKLLKGISRLLESEAPKELAEISHTGQLLRLVPNDSKHLVKSLVITV